MKKILLIVFVAMCATSCVGYGAKDVGDEFDVQVSKLEYDGHTYLLFDGYGVIHNPNCECTKEE